MIDFESEVKGTRKKPPIATMHVVILNLVVAVISVVGYFANICYVAAIFGAIGLVFGGYGMGIIRKRNEAQQNLLLALCAVALLMSVFGFMLGFVGIAKSL